ncbi:hypothetical protein JCM11491_005184 [Sporobolomyces phaffii]
MSETAAASSAPEVYTVWARETPFRLTRSQIEFDSPNYFTSAFLSGQFAESASREIRTDKHPQLFALVVEHVSGYTILPLQPSALPSCMSVKAAHENLSRDAKYFGLDQLVALLDSVRAAPTLPGGMDVVPLERVLEGGDLTLETKARRPFVSGQPLALIEGSSPPLFQVGDTLMYFDLEPADPDDPLAQSRLKLSPGCALLDNSRYARGVKGRISLRWDHLGQVSHLHSTPVFELDGATLGIDHLERAFVAAAATTAKGEADGFMTIRSSGGPRTVPLRLNASSGAPSLEVVAETLVFTLNGTTQSEGNYTHARATFVYAKLRTIEEWMRTRVAPAVASLLIYQAFD